MAGPAHLALSEPLVDALVTLLKANLNTEIEAINSAYADQYVLPQVPPDSFLPYVPLPVNLPAGMPAVGVQEAGSIFHDDLEYSMDAEHEYAVVAVIANVDPGILAVQLRRMNQALANVVQADRLLGNTSGSGGVMRDQGGAWSVNFIRSLPGPFLEHVPDPGSMDISLGYLSWTGLAFSSRRTEV